MSEPAGELILYRAETAARWFSQAAADEISDLDALLEAERHLTRKESGDGHQLE